MPSIRRRPLVLAAGTALAALVLVSTARAGTVSVSPQAVIYDGAPGETNDVLVQFGFKTELLALVRDTGAPVTSATPQCVVVSVHAAVCAVNPYLPPFIWALVRAGDGNDRVKVMGGRAEFYGGPGDDVLIGGSRPDNLYGEEGNDTLLGNAEGDELFGGPGDDVLTGGADGDWQEGDDGNDTIHARDGRFDHVLCGGGVDSAEIDLAFDTDVRDCEQVFGG